MQPPHPFQKLRKSTEYAYLILTIARGYVTSSAMKSNQLELTISQFCRRCSTYGGLHPLSKRALVSLQDRRIQSSKCASVVSVAPWIFAWCLRFYPPRLYQVASTGYVFHLALILPQPQTSAFWLALDADPSFSEPFFRCPLRST